MTPALDLRAAYETLGLRPGASPADVDEAYRALSDLWRLDRYRGDVCSARQAEQMRRRIDAAYQQLTAPPGPSRSGAEPTLLHGIRPSPPAGSPSSSAAAPARPVLPAPTEPPLPPSLTQRPVSAEAVCLTLVCLTDLVSTLYWLSHGEAREGNSWMASFLQGGSGMFVLAKLCTFVPAVVAAEWYRPRNPGLVLGVMRLVIAVYVTLYLLRVGPHLGQMLAGILAG